MMTKETTGVGTSQLPAAARTNERRRSRASITSTLVRICKRLDEKSDARIEWKIPVLGRPFFSQFKLKSLWVAGSYARGALECGDLDLAAELVIDEGDRPTGRQVAKALFNSPRDVNLYIGTPSENESGVEFGDAVLIWQDKGAKWQEAISSIHQNPAAASFMRPTSGLPLRPDQLRCQLPELEQLVSLEQRRIIRWTFLALGPVEAVEPLSKDEQELYRLGNHYFGEKSRQLLPFLVNFFRQTSGWKNPYLRANFNKANFGIGGTRVIIGRPVVPIHFLDDLNTCQLLIVPHRSQRGPNGFWCIERGDMHPLVLATQKLHVFGFFDEDGRPDIGYQLGPHDHHGQNFHALATCGELHTTMRAAKKWAKRLSADSDTPVSARKLSASELLQYLARLDIVDIDDSQFALSWKGKVTIGTDEVSSSADVLKALRG